MILAIESSCDESALALFDPARGLVRELISSQAAEHVKYGGVVPELASRMHLSALPLLLADFRGELAQAKTIAVTRGPGLLPCLSMGVTLARSLALARGLPIVGVNHLRAHVHSPFIAVHAQNPVGFAAARAALLLCWPPRSLDAGPSAQRRGDGDPLALRRARSGPGL